MCAVVGCHHANRGARELCTRHWYRLDRTDQADVLRARRQAGDRPDDRRVQRVYAAAVEAAALVASR